VRPRRLVALSVAAYCLGDDLRLSVPGGGALEAEPATAIDLTKAGSAPGPNVPDLYRPGGGDDPCAGFVLLDGEADRYRMQAAIRPPSCNCCQVTLGEKLGCPPGKHQPRRSGNRATAPRDDLWRFEPGAVGRRVTPNACDVLAQTIVLPRFGDTRSL